MFDRARERTRSESFWEVKRTTGVDQRERREVPSPIGDQVEIGAGEVEGGEVGAPESRNTKPSTPLSMSTVIVSFLIISTGMTAVYGGFMRAASEATNACRSESLWIGSRGDV